MTLVAQSELVEALTNIARSMRYGPDQAWIEEAAERIEALENALLDIRNAYESEREDGVVVEEIGRIIRALNQSMEEKDG